MNFLTLRSLAPNKATVGIDFGYYKKSWKIPSESVYQRTDNTMTKRKSTKGETTIHKTYT